jgi:predicted metalloprotease with PDZ domain
MPAMRAVLAVVALLVVAVTGPGAQSSVRYRFSFPEPQHKWMQVEAAFGGLPDAPLDLRMSRSSPGRYSLHDFAKNVYDVRAAAADGRALEVVRTDPHGWRVAGHGGEARIAYKVFGDRVDGTYLAIDATHAHVNMPAAVMWAKGLEDRPATLVFQPPAGQTWQVATQLHPGATAFEFTAPNLQYLMDSPVEFGPILVRQFGVEGRTFRVALHHTGTAADADRFVRDVEAIVREQREIFGEYPDYEPAHFTFLADYLPHAEEDGMEHRNSTVLTSSASIRGARVHLLKGAAHEFFHGWNVERIRPRSLEPFDLERENMSGELWLAEGFTQYYGPLSMVRAGLLDLGGFCETIRDFVRAAFDPAHRVRSAEEMSQMAPFTDGGQPVDPTNWSQTFVSYYDLGGALALALDLSLRDHSGGTVTLDDYMRAMWRVHGRPGGSRPGFVDRPYTTADAQARLAEVAGDEAFAREFFARYVRGRETADYTALLLKAGLALRPSNGGEWNVVPLESAGRPLSAAARAFRERWLN